jgi:hypothetical protein
LERYCRNPSLDFPCRYSRARWRTPFSLLLAGVGKPDQARHGLVVVLVERLVLRARVLEEAQSVDEVTLGCVARPLDAVGEDGKEGIVGGGALVRPALIAHHHLAGGEPLLGPTDEEAPVGLGNGDHDAALAEPPVVLGLVVHVADGVGEPGKEELALDQDAEVAEVGLGSERQLLGAVLGLGIGGVVVEEPTAPAQAEASPVVRVEALDDESLGRSPSDSCRSMVVVIDGSAGRGLGS